IGVYSTSIFPYTTLFRSIGEHNFKLIEEGNLQAVYDSLSKNKVEKLTEDMKMYKKLLRIKEDELRDLKEKIEDLVYEYNYKTENYNGLITLSREKDRELSLLTRGRETIYRTKNSKLNLDKEADF